MIAEWRGHETKNDDRKSRTPGSLRAAKDRDNPDSNSFRCLGCHYRLSIADRAPVERERRFDTTAAVPTLHQYQIPKVRIEEERDERRSCVILGGIRRASCAGASLPAENVAHRSGRRSERKYPGERLQAQWPGTIVREGTGCRIGGVQNAICSCVRTIQPSTPGR